MSETYGNIGPATPETPEREWACNRCMYAWDGPPICPSCSHEATHGAAFSTPTIGHSSLVISHSAPEKGGRS